MLCWWFTRKVTVRTSFRDVHENFQSGELPFRVSMSPLFCAEDQNRQAAPEAQLHSVVLRLGALLVLMLTVGHWADVFHVLVAFLGEAVCLLPSQDLLRAALKVCTNPVSLLLPPNPNPKRQMANMKTNLL